MDEGLVEIYHRKLIEEEDKTPGVTLTKFYSELFGAPFSPSSVVLFNKLIKLYGRRHVFKALVESFESGADFTKGFYGLLSYICKRYVEKKDSGAINHSLEEEILRREELKQKLAERKIKMRSPFEDGTDRKSI